MKRNDNKIKVLHVICGDLNGGATRGAYWLHRGLLQIGVESRVLINAKAPYDDAFVHSILTNKKANLFNLYRLGMDQLVSQFYKRRQKRIFTCAFFGFDFSKTKAYHGADIIHLHWVGNGFVKIKHLAKINKPLVWTMRDMWPMTGGCHYAIECKKYETGCGRCPQLGSRTRHDLSSLVIRVKQKYIPKHTRFVGISDWLRDCARDSLLFRNFDVRTIHNNVDSREFQPIDKPTARKILKLPEHEKIILTGARGLTAFYKGFDKFIEALKSVSRDHFLLFFGDLDQSTIIPLGFKFKSLGYLYDTISMRLAYSAADVFVAPSIQEGFGKTLIEAMACGTPVVCFDATGPKDVVTHKVDGYKARPYEAADLASGIEWVLNQTEKERQSIELKARMKAEQRFDVRKIAEEYRELYGEIL